MQNRKLLFRSLAAVFAIAIPATALNYPSTTSTANSSQIYIGAPSSGADVTVSTGTGHLILKSASDNELAIDDNEIQARTSGGAVRSMVLNDAGGQVSTGANLVVGTDLDVGDHLYVNGSANVGTNVNVDGDLDVDGDAILSGQSEFQGILIVTGELWYDTPPSAAGGSTICKATGSDMLGLCSSAARFKQDVTSLNGSLSKVMAMNPVTFVWKETGATDIGFIAESALGIVPELVEYSKEGEVQGFNYRHYTAVLTGAIQEQQRLIDDSQAAIAFRDDEIASLHKELAAQKASLDEIRREVAALTQTLAK